jgi:hypothetical protein
MRGLNPPGRLAAAGGMLALWLAVMVISSSPTLHHWLHDDSQNGKHECLVTLFAKGSFVSEAPASLVGLVDPACVAAPLPVDLKFVSPPEFRLPPGRAPPATLSSPRVESWSGF